MSESLIETVSRTLASPDDTERSGADLARAIAAASPERLCITLEGNLGAGKTTLARGFMRGFGYDGRVPSPTYTLVEPYDCAPWQIYHMDLYRLQDGAELEYLGISEMDEPGSVLLVEWPSRAGSDLPPKDLQVELEVLSEGRGLTISASTEAGQQVMASLRA